MLPLSMRRRFFSVSMCIILPLTVVGNLVIESVVDGVLPERRDIRSDGSLRTFNGCLSSFNKLLVKSRIIFDCNLNSFESINDSIQRIEKINPVSGSLVKRIHGCLNKLISLFPMINILFIAPFNKGPQVSIRDNNVSMLCLLILSNSAEKNSRDLSKILDQLPISEGMGVVKFLEVRA
ncbi:hypothetical protein Tco_1460798 [Tanacetum coccineum]